MRKILLTLCLFPTLLQAQNITFSAGGGPALGRVSGAGSMVSPAGMLSVSYRLQSVVLGLRADVFTITDNLMRTADIGKPNFNDYKPAIGLSAFAGKVISFRFIEVQAGLSAGIVTGKAPKWSTENPLGISTGLDIAVTHYCTKHIGFFARTAPRYVFHTDKALAAPLYFGMSVKL